jgi:hypothetical protein
MAAKGREEARQVPETSAKRSGKAKASRGRKEGPTPPPGSQDRAPVCTVAFCPICMAVTATQGAAPDALEHLLNAAREFFLAARAVVDARADDLDGRGSKPARTLERIEIA